MLQTCDLPPINVIVKTIVIRQPYLSFPALFWSSPIIVICLALLFISCERVPPEYRDFLDLGIAEQEKNIHNYPLDQQIDIMIIGFWYPIPPNHFLAREVAKNGEKIIPLLMKRLPSVENEGGKNALLYALLEIDLNHYEWRKDPKYIALLQEEAVNIQNPAWQQEVLDMVRHTE